MAHTACIIGAGRIGVKGFNTDFCYTHLEAYNIARIHVAGVADPDKRARFAAMKEGCKTFADYRDMLDECKPDIVSICTPLGSHHRILKACERHGVKGVWCEKPVETKRLEWSMPIQVNYIRRFEVNHTELMRPNYMVFHCRKDMNTVSHFTNLAQFLGCEKMYFNWHEGDYVITDYGAYYDEGAVLFSQGGSFVSYFRKAPMVSMPAVTGLGHLRQSAWAPSFMQNALRDLLTAVETGGKVASPVNEAIESEKVAREILNGKERSHTAHWSSRA